MPEDMKGLSWFRLIMIQVIVGSLLIGICAYMFRIPVDEVQITSLQQESMDRYAGVPTRVDVTYPGLGTITIDDPKELLKLKASFSQLLISGDEMMQKQRTKRTTRLLLTGVMSYLDQEDTPFQVETNTFRFGQDLVNSLQVSANIRKLQSTLIDKVLTNTMIGSAIENKHNDVYRLQQGVLTPLSKEERARLIEEVTTAARVIDFSQFNDFEVRPDAHFVIQLAEDRRAKKHWLHIDRYNSAYMVVYDLLDETNQRAYFKLNSTP